MLIYVTLFNRYLNFCMQLELSYTKTIVQMFFKTVACILTAAIAYYWNYYIKTGPIYTNDKNLSGKTVLITGDCLVYFCTYK